jgi:hypothetical protein
MTSTSLCSRGIAAFLGGEIAAYRVDTNCHSTSVTTLVTLVLVPRDVEPITPLRRMKCPLDVLLWNQRVQMGMNFSKPEGGAASPFSGIKVL